jgi:hypothetical protein
MNPGAPLWVKALQRQGLVKKGTIYIVIRHLKIYISKNHYPFSSFEVHE